MTWVSAQTGVKTQSAASPTNVPTFGSNPTAGNTVLLAIASASNVTINTIRDANNNDYVVAPHPTTFDGIRGIGWLAYLNNAPANADKTITITFSGNATVNSWAMEFSPTGGSGVFDTDAARDGDIGTSLNLPSLTPTGTHELFWAIGVPNTSITSADAPWTGADGGLGSSGYAAEYILDLSAAQAVAFTQSGSAAWSASALCFTFTPAASANNNVVSQVVWG